MKKTLVLTALVTLLVLPSVLMFADGTERLGTPSIAIASGSGIDAAGTGLELQPGTIDIEVPAAVVQVILYWEGQSVSPFPTDDTIVVNGNSVTGTLIGGPTDYGVEPRQTQTYRADITGLGLVTPGPNTLTIEGMDFNFADNGAGVVVIYDDGVNTAAIDVRDGNDFAFTGYGSPLDTTVPQVFNIAPSGLWREANLALMVAGVADDGDPPVPVRPTVVEVTAGGTTTYFRNELNSVDGLRWDSFSRPIAIPPGATSLTVQVFSRDDLDTGYLPASLVWVAAGLAVPPPPPGSQGCGAGTWQGGNGAFRWDELPDGDWNPSGENPFYHDTYFNDFFAPMDSLAGLTMWDLVSTGGKNDDVRKAARSMVAAYLNAAHADVDYRWNEYRLQMAWLTAVYGGLEFGDLHERLERFNSFGCVLP